LLFFVSLVFPLYEFKKSRIKIKFINWGPSSRWIIWRGWTVSAV